MKRNSKKLFCASSAASPPEIDIHSLDATKDLRDQIDIDSVDFLNFVIGLHKELGVEIPDADVSKLTTLNGCVFYLSAKMDEGR